MKTFKGDLKKFYLKLYNRDKFSFCKFSDGELFMLQGKKFHLSEDPSGHGYKDRYDHKDFDPVRDRFITNKLFEVLKYNHPDFYIGIIAPSDQNLETHRWMKKESGRDEEHLTWANLFVNSNYLSYRQLFIPEYKNYPIVIVCSEYAELTKASFYTSIVKDFRVGSNCTINNYELVETIKQWITENKISGHLFLFACSALGRILTYELHRLNQNNTYIDVGSTINPDIGLNLDRAYLSAAFGVPYRGGDTRQDLIREETWED